MTWQEIYDSTFFLALCGSVMAALGLVVKYCFQSKCEDVQCCGCFHIRRNVRAEVELEEFRMSNSESRKDGNEAKEENLDRV